MIVADPLGGAHVDAETGAVLTRSGDHAPRICLAGALTKGTHAVTNSRRANSFAARQAVTHLLSASAAQEDAA
ncbi:MAG: hypothetical protein AAF565_11045 [Pseudomonadota bacterium]